MAVETMYNTSYTSPTNTGRQEYTDVGASNFALYLEGEGGTAPIGFKDSTLEVWTAAVGGTQLTEGTDYVTDIESNYHTARAGYSVKYRVRVINATYQSGSIFVDCDVVAQETSAEVINELQSGITTNANDISALASLPIGVYYPVDADHSAITFSLPTGFAYGNGQLISDATSVYNGKRLRNLNGGSFVISALTWTADAGGSYATIAAQDLDAVNVGDTVSGSGIAAGSFINDITAGVATITDISASGAIDTTITGIKRYITGDSTSGGSVNDALQGFGVTSGDSAGGSLVNFGEATSNVFAGLTHASDSYRTTTGSGVSVFGDDGTNGTPRFDTRTHGAELDFVYITRIK